MVIRWSDEDDEDRENLNEQSAELMIMTGEIQDHVYHKNKDPAEVHDDPFTEDIQKLCSGTENCNYCSHRFVCTPEHMKHWHLRNAIHFTSKGVSKCFTDTILKLCKVGPGSAMAFYLTSVSDYCTLCIYKSFIYFMYMLAKRV